MPAPAEEYGLSEAKAQLSRLVAQAQERGIESVICVYNKPAAKLVPIDRPVHRKGSSRGVLSAYADPEKIPLEEDAWEHEAVSGYVPPRR